MTEASRNARFILNGKTEIGGSMAMEFDDPAVYERLVGVGVDPALGDRSGLTFEFERRIYPPGKRCLWGWRRGYIQVGSPVDVNVVRVTVYDVKLEREP